MISIRHGDLDFLVEFERGAPWAFKTYFGFKESLEALFGRKVDLVEPSAIRNPYFKESAERSRELIFEARPQKSHWDARETARAIAT